MTNINRDATKTLMNMDKEKSPIREDLASIASRGLDEVNAFEVRLEEERLANCDARLLGMLSDLAEVIRGVLLDIRELGSIASGRYDEVE